MNENYQEYLKSDTWQRKRKAVLKRDNYLCKHCQKKKAQDVHHKTYDNVGREPLSDLVSLCRECHEKQHIRNSKSEFDLDREYEENEWQREYEHEIRTGDIELPPWQTF